MLFKVNKSNNFLIKRVLKTYTCIVFVILLIVATILFKVLLDEYHKDNQYQATKAAQILKDDLADKRLVVKNYTSYFYWDTNLLSDVLNFHQKEYSDYIKDKLDLYYKSNSIVETDYLTYSNFYFALRENVEFVTTYDDVTDKTYVGLPNGKSLAENEAENFLLIKDTLLNLNSTDKMVDILVFFSIDGIVSRLEDSITSNLINIYLFNGSKQVISIDNLKLNNLSIEEIMAYEEQGYLINSYEDNEYTIITLVKPASIGNVLKVDAISLVVIITLSIIVMSLVLILIIFINRYQRQLDNLIKKMHEVQEDDFNSRVIVNDSNDEFALIGTNFNYLLDSLDIYIKNNYDLQIMQKEANMKALQAQINPHFLYNTLEYIRMACVNEGNDYIADMVFILGSMFRYNISSEKEVTLLREIEVIKLYLRLVQIRYEDRFNFVIEIKDNLEKLMIPKFIIQPLVENYIVHGIDYKREDNLLKILIYQEDDQIIIRIEDNGKGINQVKLDELNDGKFHNNSIGIKNVKERLEIYFTDVSINITSVSNLNTIIDIIIKRGD